MLLTSFVFSTGITLTVWMPSYLIHFLGYPPHLALMAQTLTLITVVIFKLVAGYIARLVDYQRLFKVASVMMAVLIFRYGLVCNHRYLALY